MSKKLPWICEPGSGKIGKAKREKGIERISLPGKLLQDLAFLRSPTHGRILVLFGYGMKHFPCAILPRTTKSWPNNVAMVQGMCKSDS